MKSIPLHQGPGSMMTIFMRVYSRRIPLKKWLLGCHNHAQSGTVMPKISAYSVIACPRSSFKKDSMRLSLGTNFATKRFIFMASLTMESSLLEKMHLRFQFEFPHRFHCIPPSLFRKHKFCILQGNIPAVLQCENAYDQDELF